MQLDSSGTWALLRELDDPDHMEFPRGHDHRAVRSRFEQLAAGLDRRFGCACEVDRGVQDASHHGRIDVPEAATRSGHCIAVIVSNFGGLVTVTLAPPGSLDEDEERALFHDDDRHRIQDELDALGYISVSPHLLETRYDGVSDLAAYRPGEVSTWWMRFFDYL
ncbi:hypothetical protein [Streptomyces cavernicola]|uniref:Uncharacterized protein n=1 Tax=Streptomyces cavernicola TaxID=3043613 RepID=A0ABT6S2Y3_9ACTN|nr:hypothetical protein [Streptomyces sp. B-S-A6]MDI3402403.1 hypothetical protein [Streptomyces sp. B-S-A6]